MKLVLAKRTTQDKVMSAVKSTDIVAEKSTPASCKIMDLVLTCLFFSKEIPCSNALIMKMKSLQNTITNLNKSQGSAKSIFLSDDLCRIFCCIEHPIAFKREIL